MASNDYPRLESQVSLLEVLKAAGLELRELRARHRALTKRIRSLRIAVGALRQMKTRVLSAQMEQTSRTSCREKTSRAGERNSNDATNLALATQGLVPLQNRDLRRACRIALLETTEPVSLDEIYGRILRRGSFFFANAEVAAWAIGKELCAMAIGGEVHQVDTPTKRRWQRISSAQERYMTLSS